MFNLMKAICKNHTGKMEGIPSLSTSCTDNKYCIARSKDKNSICHYCYAQTLSKMRTNLEKKNIRNGDFLKRYLLESDEIPFLNYAYFRFESFGDLETVQQVQNYFRICEQNKHVHFALWTKNPFIIDYALFVIDGLKKPSNLVIVESSPKVNVKVEKSYPFVDKVFTVYTKEYAKEHDIKINCGGRKCATCLRCYKKNTTDTINELKK